MQTIRTTISLPEDLYEELRLLAFEEKKSLNKLLVERVTAKKKKNATLSIDEQIKQDLAFFAKVAKSGIQIDAVKAVREERDRDNV